MNTPHIVIGIILVPMQLGGRFRYYGVAFVALYGVFNLRGKCAKVDICDDANSHNGGYDIANGFHGSNLTNSGVNKAGDFSPSPVGFQALCPWVKLNKFHVCPYMAGCYGFSFGAGVEWAHLASGTMEAYNVFHNQS